MGAPILAVVWHSDSFPRSSVRAERYFEDMWALKAQDGFLRPYEQLGTWELPMWAALLNGSVPVDCVAGRPLFGRSEVDTLFDYYGPHVTGYKHVALSLMECNRNQVTELVHRLRDTGVTVLMGGYTDPGELAEEQHVRWYPSIRECVVDLGYKYTGEYNYSLFGNFPCMPRLRMSTGCSNRCKFCDVPNEVVEEPWESVVQQAKSFEPLVFKLVYLDDKTFGQASNWRRLPEVRSVIKRYNQEFDGFIIQTTAVEVLKWGHSDWDVLREAGVRFVELGLETADAEILKAMRKPHNPVQMSKAVQRVTAELGPGRVGLNLMVGLPGATKASYGRTLGWVHYHMHYQGDWTPGFTEPLTPGPGHLGYVNCYWLSLYRNTALGRSMKAEGDGDLYDNSGEKSWAKASVHGWFYDAVLCDGREMLGYGPGTREEAVA